MNRAKLLEFFDATQVTERINVVGCGAIGSHVCEQLARLGFTNMQLYDFDKVESHNITNQLFTQNDIGKNKATACADMMFAINPEAKIVVHQQGLQSPYILQGAIILCIDNIDLRREIVKANQYNPNVSVIMDFRMRLTDAQYYFAERRSMDRMKQLLATMDFTHEEAVDATPKSACGYELSVIYTVKIIVSAGMANLVKYYLGEQTNKVILVDMNMFTLDAFA